VGVYRKVSLHWAQHEGVEEVAIVPFYPLPNPPPTSGEGAITPLVAGIVERMAREKGFLNTLTLRPYKTTEFGFVVY
jgi:hypothetical protein